ncbi:MAG: hypothetical protein J6X44_11455 [Thermoguttaceae bacterium]|nr:hypothetical protein [Thermoguttaceae bacterium]
MYKLLLIWRYLLTRRIALVSVVSVTLGVATMIVVNAVMLGFSREMENRIHGALSDVTISSRSSLRGFDDVESRLRDVEKIAGDLIEATTPTVATPGLLSYDFGGGEVITRQVQIVGIDAKTNEKVTSIAQYLQHPENRKRLSFNLYEDGYDVQNPVFGVDGTVRPRLADGGWKKRRADAEYARYRWQEQMRQREMYEKSTKPSSAPVAADVLDYSLNGAAVDSSDGGEDDPYAAALANMPVVPVADGEEENDGSSDAPAAVENGDVFSVLDDNQSEAPESANEIVQDG